MILVGIDIGKDSHYFRAVDRGTGEILVEPQKFDNTKQGFDHLISHFKGHRKDNILIGMEDTGHYHFNLLKFLLEKKYKVALINPTSTDAQRRVAGGVSKNDAIDTGAICDILCSSSQKKGYRITVIDSFDMYDMKLLTREHHNLKESLNVLKNKLQKSIDIVFPEYNSLFKSPYGKVYMDVLRQFGSADNIAHTDIRTLRNCFHYEGRGKRISLTAEELKQAAKDSIGFSSSSEAIAIRHLVSQIELVKEQISEVDKKIEEFSIQNNSPILTIPGISHFSGTSILSEIGDINNFSSYKKLIKFAGLAPFHYESSKYNAKNLPISKKGSKYLRKTLYQIITPVIQHNPVFNAYFKLKIAQGKSYRCAQGHCVRKLMRVIFQILKTGNSFDPELLR